MRFLYLGCVLGAICVLLFIIVRSSWRTLRERELVQRLEDKQSRLEELIEAKQKVLADREMPDEASNRRKRSTQVRRFRVVARTS